MIIIETTALENGAHRNQTGDALTVPDGWIAVPEELEAEAMGYLPYIDMTVSDGAITAVAQGAIPEPDPSALRSAKLSELSAACNAAIVAGCDVTLSTTTGHISLTDEDQINLTTAVGAVNQGAEGYPYHLDGQLCAIYPAADILAMGEAATAHKLYHTTYCNHLMAWARRAAADELEGITYGAELPADLAANMEGILNAVG
jgi:hypothetical protein